MKRMSLEGLFGIIRNMVPGRIKTESTVVRMTSEAGLFGQALAEKLSAGQIDVEVAAMAMNALSGDEGRDCRQGFAAGMSKEVA